MGLNDNDKRVIVNRKEKMFKDWIRKNFKFWSLGWWRKFIKEIEKDLLLSEEYIEERLEFWNLS